MWLIYLHEHFADWPSSQKIGANSNHSFAKIACHEESGYFLHVGTDKSGMYPRIYDYKKEGTSGYALDDRLSTCPSIRIQCLSSNVEGLQNASYVLINDQNELFWVRTDESKRIGVRKIPAKIQAAKPLSPKAPLERDEEQIEQVSVAMASADSVLIFWHDQQSRGHVTRANVRTGSGYSYKIAMELSA